MGDVHVSIPIELPRELTEQVRYIRQLTGVEPELIELAPRRWRISVRNERVYMEVDFRSAARGRVVWLRSALVVDGIRRQNARGGEHFGRIFRDPDNELPAEGAQLSPLPPEVDPASAPAVVRGPYTRIASILGAGDVQVRQGGKRWVVAIVKPGCDFRMNFVREGKRVYPAQRTIELVIDGRDYTPQVRNRLEDALALLTPSGSGPETPETSGSPDQGAGFGSVGVRRHSVMRN